MKTMETILLLAIRCAGRDKPATDAGLAAGHFPSAGPGLKTFLAVFLLAAFNGEAQRSSLP
jgi:hypothetical protein